MLVVLYITLCFIRRDHYIITYSLTLWRRVLLEKLTGSQVVKKFPPRDRNAHKIVYIIMYDLVYLETPNCILDCHDMVSFEELRLHEQVSRSAIIFLGQYVSVMSSEANNRITEAYEYRSEDRSVYH